MNGKIAAGSIVLVALIAGVAMYYLQVYGYYETLEPQSEYQVAVDGGTTRLPVSGFEGIDSFSSPLRYRACFTVDGDVPTLIDYDGAEPLNGPGWFECFDATRIGEDLVAGLARSVLVEGNTPYGFDRVMALYPDGRAYVWPHINACGAAHFDGDTLPEGCPPAPAAPQSSSY